MNFQAAAEDAFEILRQYNYELKMYDEKGVEVFDPKDARRFFDKKKNLQVSIVDEGDDSKVKLCYRKDIPIESMLGFMTTLRTMATKYNMVSSFKEQDGEISPKDFATQISVTETRNEMNLTEGMYGTSRSSYLRLENARMIVRHSAKINEDLMGARGRNVDTIHIENGVGERFLFPTVQLAPARAMVNHVNNGGSWGDEGGDSICKLAQDYADLGTLSRHIYLNAGSLTEDAHNARNTVREGMRKLRKTFESLCRKTRYEDTLASLKKPLCEDEHDLTESIARLKRTCTVEGRDIDDRVYETAARCLRENDVEQDEQAHMMIAGVRVSRETWDRFKKGDLSMREHPREPHGVDGYRSYCEAALTAIGETCSDPAMSEIFAHIGGDFGKTDISKSMKAFAANALKIVGWKVAKTVAPMESVKELAGWMDDKTVEKAVGEDCGHCEDDMVEEDLVQEEEAYLVTPEEMGDDDLSIADIILPTDQGDRLAQEVSVSTVENPDTGEEELPSTEYLQRLKALAGVNRNLMQTMY